MSSFIEHPLSWEEFHRDTRVLAKQLLAKFNGKAPWQGIVGIARGGLIPATILARELNIRLVDSLCIASYDHDKQGDVEVIKSIAGKGEGLLLVDDLVDTGVTAKVAGELLPEAYFVSVYAKPAGRERAQLFAREFPQDTWLHFPWDCDMNFAKPLVEK